MFTSDSFLDLSLRILTGVIVAVLAVALVMLIWNFFSPRLPVDAPVPVVEIAPKPAAPPEQAPSAAPTKGEVLLNPGQVYKCVINGRTTFSERPCPEGSKTDSAPAKR